MLHEKKIQTNTDFIYSVVLGQVNCLKETGFNVELNFYLGAVDAAKAVFLASGMLLTNKRIRTLLLSSNGLDFNTRLNNFPNYFYKNTSSLSK